jgi:type I restriction enzyme, S subunit
VAPQGLPWFGFVLGHVSSVEFVEYTNAGSTGTKMPRTSWSEMARYQLALPPRTVVEALTAQVRPLINRMIAGIHESRDLSALRDALLPRLVSGELPVTYAERFEEWANA